MRENIYGRVIRVRCWCFFLVATLACPAVTLVANGEVAGKRPHFISETVEWTWAEKPTHPDRTLPNLLFIGDSITRGYYPKVTSLLAGKANCYLFATSAASGDPRLGEELRVYLISSDVHFSGIHFNNGMHGWGFSEKEYAAGLAEMIDTIHEHEPRAQLMWATITPVHSAEGGATNERVNERNTLATRIMDAHKIPIDDQHKLMTAHDSLHDGNIHFTAEGSTLQAQQIVEMLEPWILQKKR